MLSSEFNPTQFYFAARAYATRHYPNSDVVEDFPGYAITHKLQGRKSSMKQLWVDFIREKLGRKGQKRSLVEIAELTEYNGGTHDPYEETNDGLDTNEQLSSILQRVYLNAREKQFLVDYYYSNKTLAQVAKTLGVTESRASQFKAEIIEKIRRSLKMEPVKSKPRPKREVVVAQVEAYIKEHGVKAADACRALNIATTSYYNYKSELKRMSQQPNVPVLSASNPDTSNWSDLTTQGETKAEVKAPPARTQPPQNTYLKAIILEGESTEVIKALEILLQKGLLSSKVV